MTNDSGRTRSFALPAIERYLTAATLLLTLAAPATAKSGTDIGVRSPGACEQLQVQVPSKLAFHAYAAGVQIYRWNGASWTFVAPEAALFADAGGNGVIGIHYGGPTWQSVSGSKVVGTVLDRCTPDPNAIPWLLLAAVPDDGPGIFQRVAFIQRVNTVGGTPPVVPGVMIGDEARVPYTAEYLFYRLK